MFRKHMRNIPLFLVSSLLTACVGMPETITPVKNFDLDRYLGKWY
jgi:apolipoprotein D and lipocalin family protein